MQEEKVTLADRFSSAVLSAVAGCITGALVWVLFAMWLGRFFFSLESLHFLDTVKWFAVTPAVIGFVAPNIVLELFEVAWKWTREFIKRTGVFRQGDLWNEAF